MAVLTGYVEHIIYRNEENGYTVLELAADSGSFTLVGTMPMVSDAEIVKAAQQRAAEITAAAQSESRTLRQTVTDYCDNMLKTTEEAMVENAAQVKNVRANLRQNAKKNG